jgi:hypothetical protein
MKGPEFDDHSRCRSGPRQRNRIRPARANGTGLQQENFQIWEDKVEQKVEHFSSEDTPMKVPHLSVHGKRGYYAETLDIKP